jgi:hypothetical protein
MLCSFLVLLAVPAISLTVYGFVYLVDFRQGLKSLERFHRATYIGPFMNEKTGDHIETAKSDSTERPTRQSNGHDDDGDWQLIPNLNKVERMRPRSPQTPLHA